ncbi:molybdenum cofactor guanylyltransferase MobA [Acidihalobacter ferrooxydans]|uniref:Molybdenum cofactor guanylyltransferase n=1 Tax=Acidihalobacter ferrooxydans TaxID=1765967 RepID=A0A1P8UK31_9GAMM|nr:molybdenum cofactor guanylyltransferase MobA [Acidihalobacter ferrooxydans]APZ44193.1 hypothetical protein BW247_14770 [Acidihalobacter ferrooxydans]
MPLTTPERARITAVILAGGAGRRMGGEDKGLLDLAGRSLTAHVLECIRPQVGQVVISANRNAARYARFGVDVIADETPGFQGPLAGIAAALAHIDTPLLLSLPCDTPFPPANLAERLQRQLAATGADLAVVHDGQRLHPVFALLRRSVLPALQAYLASGGRKMHTWIATQRHTTVDFADAATNFDNINTPEQRDRLAARLTGIVSNTTSAP